MKPLTSLTENFLRAFLGNIGSIRDTCGCGRAHAFVAGNEPHFDPGELEEFQEKSAVDPDRYITHDYSHSQSGTVENHYFVMDCPCLEERFGRMASHYWKDRHQILEFFWLENKSRLDDSEATRVAIQRAADGIQ